MNALAGIAKHLSRAAIVEAARDEQARRSLAEFVKQAWQYLEGSTELSWWFHLDAVCAHIQAQLEDWARARTYSAKEWAALVEQAAHTAILRAQNMAVALPPRCLKTIIVTICATAWAWVHWPHMRIITFSSNPRIISDASHRLIGLLQTPWYRRVANGAADQREKRTTGKVTGWERWHIPKESADSLVRTVWSAANRAGGPGGFRAALGIESGFTGTGADWLISDDPHNSDDVFSDAKRGSVHRKWDNEIYNRVNDPTRSIRTIVMQRQHTDDLTAHVFAERMQVWWSLVLALEYDGHPPVNQNEERRRREAGEDVVGTWLGWSDPRRAPDWAHGPILHPDRFPTAFVAELKVRRLRWSAQYQQRPDQLAGGMFPAASWKFWVPAGFPTPTRMRPDGCKSREELPARVVARNPRGQLMFDWVDLTVDASVKKTEDGSRVGLVFIGGIGPDRFVIHDASRRMDYPEMKKVIRALVRPSSDPFETALAGARHRLSKVLIEDKANGPAAIAELQQDGPDGEKWPGGVSIVPIGTGDDNKVSRAVVLADNVQGGQWYLLDGADWLDSSCGDIDDDGFVPEFSPFPGGRRDDRIDATSQCANHENESQADWTKVEW